MKKSILLLAATLAFSQVSFAQEEATPAPTYCDQIERAATGVMQARQQGTTLRDLITLIGSSGNTAVDEIYRGMIIAAYKVPRYSGKDYQQRAVTEFANEFYMMCI